MSNHASDVISQLVYSLRVRHICTALAAMVVGEEQDYSVFEGDLGTGFFWTVDALGSSHALAWGDAGLVALVLEVSENMVERQPTSCLKDAPPVLRELVSRVLSHEYVNEVATAGFWLTTEAPNLDRLTEEEGLRALRGYVSAPEAEMWGPGKQGWEAARLGFLPKEFALFAIEVEKASRSGSYDISAEQGQALMPPHWFHGSTEARKPAVAPRLIGDSITLENVELTVKMLAEVGISWRSAVETAKARGVDHHDEDSETGNDWTSALNLPKLDPED